MKIGSVNKLMTFLLIALALVASFTVNYGSIANQEVQPVYFSIVGTSFYFFVAALLTAALLCLLQTLKTKFDDDLKLEIGTLLTFMIYFTITFCIRGGAMILVYPFHLWPQFNYTWEHGDFYWWSISWWAIQFMFYTVFPIALMATVHHRNFKNRAHYSASPTLFNHKSGKLSKDIHGVLLDATSMSSS